MILEIETLPDDLSIVVQKTQRRFFDKTKLYQNSEQLNISKNNNDTIIIFNNVFAKYKHTYGGLRASHGSHITGCT